MNLRDKETREQYFYEFKKLWYTTFYGWKWFEYNTQRLYQRNGKFSYYEEAGKTNNKVTTLALDFENIGTFELNKKNGNLYYKTKHDSISFSYKNGRETTNEIEPLSCLSYVENEGYLYCYVPNLVNDKFDTLLNENGELIINIKS